MTETNGLQLLADMEAAGAITTTGLVLTKEIPYDQYEALATMLGSVHRRSAWALGDLLNYGEKVFGETYVQASLATGLAHQTCQNYAWVARAVPRERRRPHLAFSAHEAVAKLEPEQQEHWLGKAETERWTREEMRVQMRELTAADGTLVVPPKKEWCDCCGQLL